MAPQRGLEAQTGQALRHPVVDLVGDAVALGVDGFRLAPALHLCRDIFHRNNHVTGVSRIGCSHDAHGKTCAVPTLVRGLRRHRLALLDPLRDAPDGCPGIFGYQVGGRHACELGGRVAVDQFRPPVGFQDDRRGRGCVGDHDADGHVLEQVAISLLAGTDRVFGLAGRHTCSPPRNQEENVTMNVQLVLYHQRYLRTSVVHPSPELSAPRVDVDPAAHPQRRRDAALLQQLLERSRMLRGGRLVG